MTITIIVENSMTKNDVILKTRETFLHDKPAVFLHYNGGETDLTLKTEIARWVQGCERLAIMGIGNPLRGDDGVGVEIVNQLTNKVPECVKLINCEMVPENFLSEIEAYQPTHMLIIDAAELKAKSGETRLILPEKMVGTAFSTHIIPLLFLAGIINEVVKSKILVLGIQPYSTGFGEELSPELQMATKKIVEGISKALMEIK